MGNLKLKYNNWGLFVLIVHVSGVIGLMSPFREWFLYLTPLTLVFSFILLLYYHKGADKKFWFLTVGISLIGLIIEIIGVNTGYPFGDYYYDWAMGPKIMGVPFVIGLNWFVMSYMGAFVFQSITNSRFVNALLSGCFIALLDVIIEPVAIHSSYWTWEAESVPIQNYLTWIVLIGIFSYFIMKWGKLKNEILMWILISQVLFFSVLSIYYLF